MTSTSITLRGRLGDNLNEQQRILSRSPHPYHRRGPSLVSSEFDDHRNISSERDGHPVQGFSSESGTEADDEGGQRLKSLPAAPIRASKGLRIVERDRGAQPIPPATPGVEDDRILSAPFLTDGTYDGSRGEADSERRRIREKYTRRRRAEVIRRLTELGLFCTVGSVVCLRPDVKKALHDWYQGKFA